MPLTFLTDTSIHQVLEVFISKSSFQSLFSEYDDIVEGELPQFEISDIKFEQTIEAPLTPTDTATLSGTKNPPTSCLFPYVLIQATLQLRTAQAGEE